MPCLPRVSASIDTRSKVSIRRSCEREHFAVTPEIRRVLTENRKPAYFTADYRTYQYQSQPLSPALRQSLLDDLELSDRDKAG